MKNKLPLSLVKWLLQLFVLILCFASTPSYAIETITYYHTDGLGSPVAGTDTSGALLWKEDYKPYGERIRKQVESDKNTRWYTGHPEDKETGLTYAGARFYDSVTGRFLAIDPVGFTESNPQMFNRYAYANNNPYKYVDPDGESAEHVDGWLAERAEAQASGVDTGTLEGANVITELGQRNAVLQIEAIAAMASSGSLVGWFGIRSIEKSFATGISSLFKSGRVPNASDLIKLAGRLGWKSTQTARGPLKYVDNNGVTRITIKKGSLRTPGSGGPHVEFRNPVGKRIDPQGNPVARKSPGNHTPINYDL